MADKKTPIRVAYNEVEKVTQSSGANGSVLKMALRCGACNFLFSRSYSLAQLAEGYPHEECPNCKQMNFVPYTISGRNGN